MKRLSFILTKVFATISFFLGTGYTTYAEVNPKPFVIPELTSWTGAEGKFIPTGRVIVKGNKEIHRIVTDFITEYKQLTGKNLTIAKGKAVPGDFIFDLSEKNKTLGEEGYSLEVGNTARLSATTAKGLFWGTRTILQISEQTTEHSIPKGITTDIPEYKLRGMVIDCGRKYIPIDYLQSLVKIMAYYKMNTLEVHLNDNGFRQYFNNDWDKTQAAFRLECDTYPGLTAKDGSYTKKEFIDLQILGENNFVEIIPEIDVPAHSLAFTRYKPEIASKDYGKDHLDLFKPETYEFVDGLFKEYLEGKNPVFRGPRVHIGTDEYSNAKKDVVEKFRSFTDHYIKYVESFGKKAVLWGALTHAKGDTPVKADNVLMFCWYNGYADPKDMKEKGYQLVSIPDGLVYIVPAAGYYYDYLNCKHLYNNWTPATIGNQKFEENDPAIEGGMFAVWNDHAGNGISTKDIHHRIYPALQTLAVKCWTGKNTKLPYEEFEKQSKNISEAPDVNELGRWFTDDHRLAAPNDTVFTVKEVTPGMNMPREEIGYDYSVSFTIDGVEEKKGTELFRSKNAVFYLSDPQSGRIAFARDGYLNKFNYAIKPGTKVTITIQGNNKMTRLLINGKQHEELNAQTVYVIGDKIDYQYGEEQMFKPTMYTTKDKMHYQRTLVFPLAKAGNFNSKISDLIIVNSLGK